MHFTDFMGQASVEENSFSRCGLARIDVGNNTDVSVSLNGSRSWHFEIPRWLTGSAEPILLIKLELTPETLLQNQYPENNSPESAVLKTIGFKNDGA
jgi:hypothetical protein